MPRKPKTPPLHKKLTPALTLYIDPGDATVETIRDVLVALNNLYVASGGDGLVFEEKEKLKFAVTGAVA